ITDGEDNHSRYSLGNVREFAREHDVMIYSIGIISPMDEQYGGFQGRGVLSNLADLTGGEAFFPETIQALPAICQQIGLDLKTQYLLGYRSQNLTTDGKWRKIRVKINTENRRSSLKVRAKSGYYAPTTPRILRGGDQ